MTRKIVFANQKGGVGKTTSCINIAASLAKKGRKILCIDLDPQGNLTTYFGIDENEISDCNIYNALTGSVGLEKTIINKFGVDIVPSDIGLSDIDIELSPRISRESILKSLIESEQIKNRSYDYILIDCNPSLSIVSTNALVASNEVFIPMHAEYFALKGIELLIRNIKKVRSINPDLKVTGVILTKYKSAVIAQQENLETVTSFFPDAVFKTKIRENTKISESSSHGEPVMYFDPNCNGSLDYGSLALEIIKMENEYDNKEKKVG